MSCGAASSYLAYLVKFDEIHLELADLRVKGERVKEHRADERDVGRLAGQQQSLGFNLMHSYEGGLLSCEKYSFIIIDRSERKLYYGLFLFTREIIPHNGMIN